MTALTNRAGPTRTWKTIKGKKVKTSDGKDIGEIKKISENHLLLEQGRVHKQGFWIPKYVADAFDGKVLWLMLSEEEVRGRYQYGKEPPTQDNYANELEKFRKTPYGQKISYAPDFNENIRVVENYSNIRDLQSTAETEIQEPVKQEIDVPRKVYDQKEEEKIIKDTGMSRKESSQSTDAKYYNKQPVNIKLPGTIEGSAQPIVMDKPTESDLDSSVEAKKEVNNNSSLNPIRLPASSHTTFPTHPIDDIDRDRERGSLSSNLKEPVNPVRIPTNEEHEREQALTHPKTTTTATATTTSMSPTMDKPENVSSVTLPLSSIYMSHNTKETDTGLSVGETGQTKMDEKPRDNIPTQTNIPSPSSPTFIADKDKDKDTDTVTNIQPVIAEVTQPMVEVRPEEQQIVPVTDKETSIDLMTTKSTSIEEAKPTSTSLMPTNPEHSNQISRYGEGHTTTDEDENENVGYFNPFLAGLSMWQAWLNMCSEFAAIGASLSLNWLESFWKLIPSTKEASDNT
jgi:hypothetical protein